jgi:hypothetical protein
LSAWWITLGIRPERIEPGKPQQNGRHERMHLTLKQEVASPPKQSLRAQQRAFNKFMREFNDERPHEALRNSTPAELYEDSHRRYPRKLPKISYPAHFDERAVRPDGTFKWGGRYTYLTEALSGYRVGFQRTCDRHWDIFFGPVYLAAFDERMGTIIRPSRPRRRRRS